ncbi:restriction endonuclease subunit S [Rhodopirellula baltica]
MTSNNETEQKIAPPLRFPDFQAEPEWCNASLSDLIQTITPPKKLQTFQYKEDGLFPIVDQSPHQSCGRTDDKAAVISKPLPVIVFGDHTCVLKLVDKPFVQGADGIKIFAGTDGLATNFLFQSLSANPVSSESYKRHFTKLKRQCVFYPANGIAEQDRIASCLGSLDALIAAEGRKLEALRAHKKGLTQQLFPREGETRPRRRFPEFDDGSEWKNVRLEEVARLQNGYAFKSKTYVDQGEYGIVTIGNVQQGRLSDDSMNTINVPPEDLQDHHYLSDGDILVSMTGNVGRVCRVEGKNFLLNQRVGKILPTDVDADFLYFALFQDNFLKAMKEEAAGGAQGNISAATIREYEFLIPLDRNEQVMVANCLAAVDHLERSALYGNKLLQTFKHGLMQQLFPSSEDVAS